MKAKFIGDSVFVVYGQMCNSCGMHYDLRVGRIYEIYKHDDVYCYMRLTCCRNYVNDFLIPKNYWDLNWWNKVRIL